MSKFKSGDRVRCLRKTMWQRAGDLAFVDDAPHPHSPDKWFLLAGSEGDKGACDEDYELANITCDDPIEWLKARIQNPPETDVITNMTDMLSECFGIITRAVQRTEWTFEPTTSDTNL